MSCLQASAQHGSSGSGALEGNAPGFSAGASGSGSTVNKSQITMDSSTDQPFAFSFVLVNYNPRTKKFDIDDDPKRPKAARDTAPSQQHTLPQGEVYPCPEVLDDDSEGARLGDV